MLRPQPPLVMPGLDPGIHVSAMMPVVKTWMAGSSPAMTNPFRIGLRSKAEIYAADEECVAADLVTARPRGVGNLGDVAYSKIQPAHDLVGALRETEGSVGQFQLGRAIRALRHSDADDLAPMLREPGGIRALHLDASDRLRHLLLDVLLPVGTGRRIGAEHVVAAVGVVELDEGGAAVAWMQLHAEIGRMRDAVCGAHAHRVGARAMGIGIVAAEDRHIAAAAAGLLDEAARRGAVAERRDHLQEDRVDRQQGVDETVFLDVTVAVTDLEPHDGGDIGYRRLEMRRDQTDLPQPHVGRHDQCPTNAGLRFSTKAFAASLWSAVSPAREWWIASPSKQASSDIVSALLMLRLM